MSGLLSDGARSEQVMFPNSGQPTPRTPQQTGRSHQEEADAMAALASCPLGKGLHRAELRELLEKAREVRVAKGSTCRRSEAFSFFVVVRGVLKCGWAERGRGAVLYASRVLPCFLELEMAETEAYRNGTSTTGQNAATAWYAESDVILLLFKAPDFCSHLSNLETTSPQDRPPTTTTTATLGSATPLDRATNFGTVSPLKRSYR